MYGYINDITIMKLHEEQLTLKIDEEVAKNTEKDRLLVHQSKLASMGEMLGSIAHQWRQPLNNINLLTHFIRDSYGDLSKEELDDVIKDTRLQIDYMSQTIDDFRNFFQPSSASEDFYLDDAIASMKNIIGTQLQAYQIDLTIDGAKNILIHGAKNALEHVLINLINNAKDAIILASNKDIRVAYQGFIRVEVSIEENQICIRITL